MSLIHSIPQFPVDQDALVADCGVNIEADVLQRVMGALKAGAPSVDVTCGGRVIRRYHADGRMESFF
jgi:hypothetical protein